MFTIAGIDHIVLRVVDLDKMLRFYIDTLGCTLEKVQESIGLYQLRAGRSLIDLIPIDGPLGKQGGAAPEKEGRNLEHFCLRIDMPGGGFDGDALIRHLKGKGVEPGEVASRYGADGQGPSIYVSDPEGNVVELKGPPFAKT